MQRTFLSYCWLALLGWMTGASVVRAADDESASQIQTFWAILSSGWQINLVLLFLAFLTFFLIFYYLLITRKNRVAPSSFENEILDDIASGDIERAQKRAVEHSSLLAETILPGLKLHDHPIERIHQAMEGAGRRALGGLRQQVTFLSNIGVLCPMIGLLGTVLGLFKTFKVMATEDTSGSKAMMMSAHIGEAISTTIVGLIVGIFAMGAYFLCRSRLGRINDEVEIAAENISAALGEAK